MSSFEDDAFVMIQVLSSDIVGKDEEEEEDLDSEEDLSFIAIKTILSVTEQQALSMNILRNTLINMFSDLLRDDDERIFDLRVKIPKISLADSWVHALARPLPPFSPGPNEDNLTTHFIIDFHPNAEYRTANFIRLLFISKLFSPDCRFVIDGKLADRGKWLMDEELSIFKAIHDHNESSTNLHLHLIREIKRPMARIECVVKGSTENRDGHGKIYTKYSIEVRQDSMIWHLDKRYSEFVALHREIMAQKSSDRIASPPSLPPSGGLMDRIKYSRQHLTERRIVGLQEYLFRLIESTLNKPNRLVLSFLGMMSDKSRPNTIPLSKLSECRVGDIVLFKSLYPASQLQRIVTRSSYDHVGLVVLKPTAETIESGQGVATLNRSSRSLKSSRRELHILEATGEGVTINPLMSRLQAYHYYNCCEAIALRRIELGTENGVSHAPLLRFLCVAQTRPYKLSLRDLFQSKELAVGGKDQKSTATELFPDLNERSFFCSALVAAALKSAAVLPEQCNERWFWPGSFQKGGHVDKLCVEGMSYGPELLIDCRELEILHVEREDSPRQRPIPIHEESEPVNQLRAPANTFVPSLI